MAMKQRAAAKDTGARAHGFWDKQPVPKLAEKPDQNEPIETKTVADVRATPYKLPPGFSWSSVDVADEKQVRLSHARHAWPASAQAVCSGAHSPATPDTTPRRAPPHPLPDRA